MSSIGLACLLVVDDSRLRYIWTTTSSSSWWTSSSALCRFFLLYVGLRYGCCIIGMNVLLLLCLCPLLAGYVPNWFGRGVSNLSMSNLPNVLSCCTFVLYLVFICVACFSVLGDRVTFAAFFLCNMFLLSVSWRGALPAMLLLLQKSHPVSWRSQGC